MRARGHLSAKTRRRTGFAICKWLPIILAAALWWPAGCGGSGEDENRERHAEEVPGAAAPHEGGGSHEAAGPEAADPLGAVARAVERLLAASPEGLPAPWGPSGVPYAVAGFAPEADSAVEESPAGAVTDDRAEPGRSREGEKSPTTRPVGLMGPDGSVEAPAGGPNITVWVYREATDALYFPASAPGGVDLSLAQGGSPIPKARWQAGENAEVVAELTALEPKAPADARFFLYRIQLFNTSGARLKGAVCVVMRPWRFDGSAVSAAQAASLDGVMCLQGDMPIWRASRAPAGLIELSLWRSIPEPLASAIVCFDIDVKPADGAFAASTPVWDLKLVLPAGERMPPSGSAQWPGDQEVVESYARAHIAWSSPEVLGKVRYEVPDKGFVHAYHSALSQLIVAANARPFGLGRSPLPDSPISCVETAAGAMALNRAGRFKEARRVLAGFDHLIRPDGMVLDGANNAASAGRAVTALVDHFRLTRDTDWLARRWPLIEAAAGGLAARDGPGPGSLLPGQAAPVEPGDARLRYADAFWAATGLEEAGFAARELVQDDDAVRFSDAARALRGAIRDSIRASMDAARLNTIPPHPCFAPGEGKAHPEDALALGAGAWPGSLLTERDRWAARSFELFYNLWYREPEGAMRDGGQILAAGIELGSPLVGLRQGEYADRILDWYSGHSTLPGAYMWAEIMDPAGDSAAGPPSLSAAAAYVCLLRNMLILERGDYIVLAPGVTLRWVGLDNQAGIENAPTVFGSLSYRMTTEDGKTTIDLLDTTANPAKGYIFYQLYDAPDAPIKVDGRPYRFAVHDQTVVIPSRARRIEIQW